MGKGALHVVVQGCSGLDDDSWFNKADPYAIVTCGSQKHKTPTAKNAGKNPTWNSSAEFIIDSEDFLDVRIYDHDVGFDDFLGQAKVPLSGAISKGASTEIVPVKTKAGKEKGQITLVLKFSGSGTTVKPASTGHDVPGHSSKTEHKSSHDKPHKEKKDKKHKKEKKHSNSDSSSSSSDSD